MHSREASKGTGCTISDQGGLNVACLCGVRSRERGFLVEHNFQEKGTLFSPKCALKGYLVFWAQLSKALGSSLPKVHSC